MSAAGLLCAALLSPAATAGAPWPLGHEWIFAGSVEEEQDRPASRYRRSHALSVRVLVLERGERWVDVAVMTQLRRTDDAASDPASGVAGPNPSIRTAPPHTRLDLLRIRDDGTVVRLMPTGAPPLRLDRDTPTVARPALAVDAISPFEFGMFPPLPRGEGESWTAVGPEGPPEQWSQQPAEFVNAVQCAKLELVQQSNDWTNPQAGRASWQRRETVWLSERDRTVRQLGREILTRDGVNAGIASRIAVKYALQSRGQIIGRTFDRCRLDIDVAATTTRDFAALLAEGQRLDAKWLEARAHRLNAYLRDSEPGTPFREAVLASLRRIEAARRGDPLSDGP